MSTSPFAIPTLPELAQSIRAGFSKLLAGPGFPQDPSLVSQPTNFRFQVTEGGQAVGNAAVQFSIYPLPATGEVLDEEDFTTDGTGNATGTLKTLTYNLAQTYRVSVYVQTADASGVAVFDLTGYVIRSQGIVGTLDLKTGSSSANTGGTTQGSGTGSGVVTYGPISITYIFFGKPMANASFVGSLWQHSPGQPLVQLPGSVINGSTDANGVVQPPGKWDNATDASQIYEYHIARGSGMYVLYYNAGDWPTGVAPDGLAIEFDEEPTGAAQGEAQYQVTITAKPRPMSVSGPSEYIVSVG